MIYEGIKQILRKRGRAYQIIATELEDFFSHDYAHHYFRPDYFCTQSSGGDAWDWELKDNIVYLSSQFGRKNDKPIQIELTTFRVVVKLLGDSRNLNKRWKNVED